MVLLRKFNPEIHHRRSIRLKGYDYTRPGYYFFTICTMGRENLFWEIINKRIQLNNFGKILEMTWLDLPNHNTNLILDSFVIMPDHFHGIIRIIKKENSVGVGSASVVNVGAGLEPAPTESLHSEPAPTESLHSEIAPTAIAQTVVNHPLSEIIRQLKTFSARRINEARNMTGISVWQRDYYETIIRNELMLKRIRKYIRNNPANLRD
jgi:putative transposase